jgi:DNA polymerase-3 subunit delta'
MSWSTIRGHDAVRKQLLAAFQAGRFAHAYLFVGPDGVGKRRFATELAKSLLCEASPGPLQPCDRCHACVQVAAGTHPDFFIGKREDDKNELTVEAMRAFCHKLGLKPARGSRKVGLLEEADEFNASSANAFLKPLEEPPPGSTLILLATSTDRQLPTILSRCQVIPFRPLGPTDLRAVLADHGVTDPTRVDRLARLSHGSPGRALALNDDAFWSFRQTLFTAVTAARPDPAALAGAWIGFAEEAGKQGSAQRERATLALGLLVEILQQALRASVAGGTSGGDTSEAGALSALGERAGPDRIAGWLEACLDAEAQIGRYVQLVLVIEALLDRMFRRTAA